MRKRGGVSAACVAAMAYLFLVTAFLSGFAQGAMALPGGEPWQVICSAGRVPPPVAPEATGLHGRAADAPGPSGVRGLIAILVIGGIVFPLTGLSLAVLLFLDQVMIRVQARRRDRRAPA